MTDLTGPTGFQHIDTAPRDGSFVRLRFRRVEGEQVGQWLAKDHMKAGGAWFDRDGFYVTPGPLFWAPTTIHGDSSYDA